MPFEYSILPPLAATFLGFFTLLLTSIFVLSFMELSKKNISKIDFLKIDVESSNYKLAKCIVDNSSKINAIQYEFSKGPSNIFINLIDQVSNVYDFYLCEEDKFIKIIAGKFENSEGPIKKHNVDPIYFDVELNESKTFNHQVPSTHNSFIYLIEGEIEIGNNKHESVKDSTLILLSKGENLKVTALTNAKFLLISGKPIGEQIARGGPFVMNTKQEILQAIDDYHNGNFVK